METLTDVEARRIHVDRGYRGYHHETRLRVFISGQIRRTTKTIKREMKRRAAIEPVIGHMKTDHRVGRNFLKGANGDQTNAVLAAEGYNFSLLLRWFERLWRVLISMLISKVITAIAT